LDVFYLYHSAQGVQGKYSAATFVAIITQEMLIRWQ